MRRRPAGLLLTLSTLAGGLWGCARPEPATLCEVELRYEAGAGEAARVEAVGDWNGWQAGRTVLVRQPEGDFAARLELAPGEYEYRLILDDLLALDPAAPLLRVDAIGREFSLLRVDDCRLPSFELRRAEATGESALLLEASFVPGVTGDGLDTATVRATVGGLSAVDVEIGELLRVHAEGLAPGRYTVRLDGRDTSGRAAAQLIAPIWVEPARREPFSWEDGLIYQVVLDRFALSGPPLDEGLPREEALTARHGGDLRGLLEVVESGYFEHLGVNTLWLSPLYDNPDDRWPWYLGLDSSAYHGYWPIDSRAVEPLLGGEEAARALVEEAHARGLRIILDVVPNHVHIEHPYYALHAQEGWFNGQGECVCGSSCSWADDIDHCWFSEYLPDLRWRNPAVARQVVADTLFWLDEFDLDGLRIDAIPMMPLSATRELVWAVHRRFERSPVGVHLLGETYADDHETITRALGPFGLDGQFDFPTMWALRRVIGRGEGSMEDLEAVIEASEEAWSVAGGGDGGQAIMSPFIGNHDVPRFLSEASGDVLYDPVGQPPERPAEDLPYRRLRLAQLLALTLPGAPVIYYGDEIGLPGASDPDNRRPMRFDDLSAPEAETLELTARLGRLRACLWALRRGARSPLLIEDDLAATLRDAGDGDPAILAVNRSIEAREISLELPRDLLFPGEGPLVDALTGDEIPRRGRQVGPITLEGMSGVILVSGESSCRAP